MTAVRTRDLFPDISFGHEPSNLTGGTFTHVDSGFPGTHPIRIFSGCSGSPCEESQNSVKTPRIGRDLMFSLIPAWSGRTKDAKAYDCAEENSNPGKKTDSPPTAKAQALAAAGFAEARVCDPASLGGCGALLLRLVAEI